MNITIALTLTGIVLGAVSLGYGGWLAGGVIGYLAGQLKVLLKRHQDLEREVAQLKKAATDRHYSPSLAVSGNLPQPEVASTETLAADGPLKNFSIDDPAPVEPGASAPLESLARPEHPLSAESSVPPASPVSGPAATLAPQPQIIAVSTSSHETSSSNKETRPDPFDKLRQAVRRFFTEGNVIVRIGMVVMFFGLSFLVKYASNQGLLPLELRLTAVVGVAFVLILLGWTTRNRAGGYGLVLQGGGIAALYLTIFAAAKIYSLMPSVFAFALMFAVVIFGVFLSVIQNAQILALMATAGGFLAPIITSDGSGNHVALFTFYLILNLGILAVAWFKTWRALNWIGFIFTFAISVLWGVLRYEPQFYSSAQPFLLLFFLLYLALSVLFSIKQPPKLSGLVDGSLIFGLPLIAFGLQAKLLDHTDYGLAISAMVLAVIYLLLARGLWLKLRTTHQLLIDSFVALGVGFATLAIPLALGAAWTSAAWALEAVGLVWIGLRQERLFSRAAGYLLHVVAGLAFWIRGEINAGAIPLLTGDFINLLVLASSALMIAWLLARHADAHPPETVYSPESTRPNGSALLRDETHAGLIATFIGWGWWLIAGCNELLGHVGSNNLFAATCVFFALSTAAILLLSRVARWSSLIRVGFWLLPLTAIVASIFYAWSVWDTVVFHPTQAYGLLALAVFATVQYRFLWRNRAGSRTTLLSTFHIATAWFLMCLLFWEASWWQNQQAWQDTAGAILWFACLALPLAGLVFLSGKFVWPFNQYASDYRNVIPAPLLFLLLLWFIKVSAFSGAVPFPYIPVVNPVDIAQLGAILLLAWAVKGDILNLSQATAETRYGLVAGAAFIWVNLVLLRAIHHYGEVAYEAPALWNSASVQMALSILWTVCALVLMNLSRRLQERHWWLVGAGLLGIVVVKLFTKDLTGSGTLARIVSFLVVGGLMLLIGYLSPIPAKRIVTPDGNLR